MIRSWLFAGCCVLASVALAPAQEPADAKVERKSLVLTPAAEPTPALRHSLWVSDRDLKPGNGATFYYRAMLLKNQNAEGLNKAFPAERVETWLTVPLQDFPTDEVQRYVDAHRSMLNELEQAVCREKCDWNLRVQDLRGLDVVSFLLHDFQIMRDMARVVAYKARLEVAQGKYNESLASLRMGYRMARDAAEPPLLINALIGMAISQTMSNVAVDLMDSPNSPNLYWALKQMPHPLIDIRAPLQFELSMPFQMFPYLKDAETAVRTPEQWQALIAESAVQINAASGQPNNQSAWQIQLTTAALVMKAYPTAKKSLIASGMEASVVEKMPVAQVVAIQAARDYRYTYEEMFKWTLLPQSVAHTRLAAAEKKLKDEGYLGNPTNDKNVLPIATLLMPALTSVLNASARHERGLAALETIEAVRMHAAARQGELPASLDALSIVPASPNPFTGRNFDYHIDERGRAVLQEHVPSLDLNRQSRIYLIELEKAVK